MCIGAIVPHRAVIHDIGAPVWAEPDVRRTVKPVYFGYKHLVISAVAGKVLDPQGERRARQLIEVDQLDLMANFRIGIAGIRRREPEVPLEAVQRCPWLNRPTHKNIGNEVDASKGRVRPLVRQRSSDLLRWTCQYVADRRVGSRRT